MSRTLFRRDVHRLSRRLRCFCRVLVFLRDVYEIHNRTDMVEIVDQEVDRFARAVGDARWYSFSEKETNEPFPFFIETWWECHAAGWRPSFRYENLGMLGVSGSCVRA